MISKDRTILITYSLFGIVPLLTPYLYVVYYVIIVNHVYLWPLQITTIIVSSMVLYH